MKITEIVGGQCIWLLPPRDTSKTDTVRALKILRAIEERYGFLQAPRMLADYDFQKGVTFTFGQFHNDWIIEKLQIFNNGILVEAKTETSKIESFLDEIIDWAIAEFDVKFPAEKFLGRAYLSQFEIHVDMNLGELFAQFSECGGFITECLNAYGLNSPSYEAVQLTMFGDITKVTSPHPGSSFTFERRMAKPFSSNLYYSSAPLRSEDHIKALEMLLIAFGLKKSVASLQR